MIEEVEQELRREVVELDRMTPYLFNLGHVVGIIAKGLSYAGAYQQEREVQPC